MSEFEEEDGEESDKLLFNLLKQGVNLGSTFKGQSENNKTYVKEQQKSKFVVKDDNGESIEIDLSKLPGNNQKHFN